VLLRLSPLPVLAAIPAAAAESRGLVVELRESEVPGPIELYGASYALVIGNDRYTGGWPVLSKAVEDAREVAAALAARGFEDYLSRFPEGAFASLAERRLAELKEPTVAAVVPPPRPRIEGEALETLLVALKNANVRAGPSTESDRMIRQ
jgi:hypothetical protein